MGIGARLKEERMRVGLSQAEIAALGGLSNKTQLGYESDARSPDANYLAALRKVGIDVLYVITGERISGTSLSAAEDALLQSFRQLDDAGQAAALASLKSPTTGGCGASTRATDEEAELLDSFRQLNDVGRTAIQASINGFLLVGTMTIAGAPAKRIPRLAENRVAMMDEAAREALKEAQADAARAKRARSPRKSGENDQD